MSSRRFDEATFLRFFRTLDEHQARLCAAERALALGLGGITRLSRGTSVSTEKRNCSRQERCEMSSELE